MDVGCEALEHLRQAIEARSARIAVVGMGYVGLPLAVEFARAGFRVTGIDLDREKVAAILQGRSYVKDVPSGVLGPLARRGYLGATSHFDVLRDADAISICVPTPLGKTKDPDMSYVLAAADRVAANLRRGQIVVLESTTYPGTTEELLLPRLAGTGLRAGEDFCLAFSPERVDPGNPTFGIRNTPKVVGGITARCTELAAHLYRQAIETVVTVSSTVAAETVKLLENTFRSVNIGLVNEIAMMCDRLGIDVWEVIDAAKTKPFGFMPFYPGPGLGGHCIPIDPHYLSWKMRTLNYRARFIELAGEVNSEMPRYVVRKVEQALNEWRLPVNGSRILVIGVAYKRDIDDVRESPALDIIKLLQQKGAEVAFHDPHVPALALNGTTLHSVPADAEGFDCAVIATDHRALDVARIVERHPVVVDTRNAANGFAGGSVVRL